MKKRKTLHYMVKSYKSDDMIPAPGEPYVPSTMGKRKDLEEETRKLSLLAARYEVLYVFGLSRVCVRVRCRTNSKVYNLCKELGYTWN